jgi:hypothetical protein
MVMRMILISENPPQAHGNVKCRCAPRERVPSMNLAVLKQSRRRLHVGDIFAMQPPDGLFLFGRVISVDANPLGVGGGILVYIYRARSSEKACIPKLLRGQLLVPPMMTNRLGWSKGYFEFLENQPLGPMDILPQHCFKDSGGRYFNEHGERLAVAVEPVGGFGLDSYRTIDDEISKALGIPLAPDD